MSFRNQQREPFYTWRPDHSSGLLVDSLWRFHSISFVLSASQRLQLEQRWIWRCTNTDSSFVVPPGWTARAHVTLKTGLRLHEFYIMSWCLTSPDWCFRIRWPRRFWQLKVSDGDVDETPRRGRGSRSDFGGCPDPRPDPTVFWRLLSVGTRLFSVMFRTSPHHTPMIAKKFGGVSSLARCFYCLGSSTTSPTSPPVNQSVDRFEILTCRQKHQIWHFPPGVFSPPSVPSLFPGVCKERECDSIWEETRDEWLMKLLWMKGWTPERNLDFWRQIPQRQEFIKTERRKIAGIKRKRRSDETMRRRRSSL